MNPGKNQLLPEGTRTANLSVNLPQADQLMAWLSQWVNGL